MMLWCTLQTANHTQRQRDMQILSTATAQPKQQHTNTQHDKYRVIRTNDSPPTQTGTEEQGEAGMHMEIGWQHPEVFPGGPQPLY